MMKQYPHRAIISTVGASSINSDGDFTAGAPVEPVTEECRAESSSSSGYLTDNGGRRIDYSWIVYFSLASADKVEGTKMQVRDGDRVLLHDTIKRFSRGQFNCRAWL